MLIVNNSSTNDNERKNTWTDKDQIEQTNVRLSFIVRHCILSDVTISHEIQLVFTKFFAKNSMVGKTMVLKKKDLSNREKSFNKKNYPDITYMFWHCIMLQQVLIYPVISPEEYFYRFAN